MENLPNETFILAQPLSVKQVLYKNAKKNYIQKCTFNKYAPNKYPPNKYPPNRSFK
jgi:hypothetical protein